MLVRVKRAPLETVEEKILIHGELIVDTTDWIIRMGDSETPGGQELSNSLALRTKAELEEYIPKDRKLVADTDDWILRVGDGVTPGGQFLSMGVYVDTIAGLDAYVIPENVLAVDNEEWLFRIGDGVTAGGIPISGKILVDDLPTIEALVVDDGTLVADNDDWIIRVGDGTTAGGKPLSTRIIVDTRFEIDGMIIPDGLLAVDTTDYILRIGDGVTEGGVFLTDDDGSGGGVDDPPPPPPVYSRMITDNKVLITGDTLSLSEEAMGGLVLGSAYVYNSAGSTVAEEYTCHINTSNYIEVIFDSSDGLNGKYATVTYMSTGEHIEDSQITTVTRSLISSNKIDLPSESIGDIVMGYARIFDAIDSIIYNEYTCSVSDTGMECLFDSGDSLNGKYATFTYHSVS